MLTINYFVIMYRRERERGGGREAGRAANSRQSKIIFILKLIASLKASFLRAIVFSSRYFCKTRWREHEHINQSSVARTSKMPAREILSQSG